MPEKRIKLKDVDTCPVTFGLGRRENRAVEMCETSENVEANTELIKQLQNESRYIARPLGK